jgi:cytochrome c peroxidase
MKVLQLLGVSLMTSSFLFGASALAEKAKHNGLVAIPQKQSELMKLTDPKGQITPERVALGKQLYFDPRLSMDGKISCNTCHLLDAGGVDGIPTSIGHKGLANPHHINAPTVYNAVFFERQFWDGRSPDLEDQAKGPMQAPVEMAITPELAVKRITDIPAYVEAFKKAYGDDVKIDFDKIASTIALYERTLVTPSRFDDFLNGKEDALTDKEKEGLALFIETGCTACHVGIAIGGAMQPFDLSSGFEHNNVGDFTGDKDGRIKAPSLRNVTRTAPYFHNGTVTDLVTAVKTMGKVQLLVDISTADAEKIVTFLKSLEGRLPDTTAPKLP